MSTRATPEEFAMDVQAGVCERILDVLENGANLGPSLIDWRWDRIPAQYIERFRALRTRVLQADLYELVYGELPSNAVNPEVRADPWSEAPPEPEART